MKTAVLIIIFAVSGIVWINKKENSMEMKNLNASINYKNGKFVNQEETPVMNPDASYYSLMKDYMKKGINQKPESAIKTIKFEKEAFLAQKDGINAVWFGHSTVLLNIDGIIMLTDPFFGERASPVSFAGTKKFEYTHDITIDELPEIDVVLISHDHYDHLDKKSIIQLNNKVKRYVVPLGLAPILKKWGVAFDKIETLDWWKDTEPALGVKITVTPARHFSGRSLKRNTTLWCSFVIQVNDKKVFYSGDSGYGKHFKQIGDQFGPFDLTLMECGQYHKNWSLIHMNPKETFRANLDLKGKKMIPLHWGKFKLSLHPWTEPAEMLLESSNGEASSIVIPEIGALTDLGKEESLNYWWRSFE